MARSLAAWRRLFGQAAGAAGERLSQHLFALHSYYSLAIKLVAADALGAVRAPSDGRLAQRLRSASRDGRLRILRALEEGGLFEQAGVAGLVSEGPFACYLDLYDARIDGGIAALGEALARLDPLLPGEVTDLFKGLYQELVPERLRHALGEFYTPDWLADYVLDRVGFTARPRARLLDPACGSGTFLVRALRRLKAGGDLGPAALLGHVSAGGLCGMDLNPLAALAARANLLLGLREELGACGAPLDLPVHRADSICAPAAIDGNFDLVVGNPPWVLWSDLPPRYRDAVRRVCARYDVFSDDAWVGGIESDIATLLTLCAADRWLRDGGRLGFVITQAVFKTRSAQGFRRFRLPDGAGLQVLHVDDMVALRPFSDAANRTAVLFLQRGSATRYPVPYHVWEPRSGSGGLAPEASLQQVLREVSVRVEEARPVSDNGGPWITAPAAEAARCSGILGGGGLRARKGTTTDFNNVFWARVLRVEGALALVENGLSQAGHQVQRKRVWIEQELLYPLARGQDVGRFSVAGPRVVLILPQLGMHAFDEATMATRYPLALAYFAQFREAACRGCPADPDCRKGLVHRASYANPKYRKALGEYWGVWNVGPYTFQPYKVAWREVSSRFQAAVLGSAALDGLGARVHVPDHKLMFTTCGGEDEAHYLCAVLNSGLVRRFAEAVSLSTSRGARIFERLAVPPYDASRPAHALLVELSRAAHGGVRALDDAFDEELDAAVAAAR